jgi:hypothetical protein
MAMLRWRLLATSLKQYGVSTLLGVHMAQDEDDEHEIRRFDVLQSGIAMLCRMIPRYCTAASCLHAPMR